MTTDTIPARLWRRAEATPDRIALRHKDLGRWQEFTWREYARRVAEAGAGLMALELVRGDRVAIIGENRPEWLWADLGAQGMGMITVGVYPTSPAAEVEYLLAHSESAVAICEDEEQLDKVLAVRDRLPGLRRIVLIETRGARRLLDDPMLLTFEALLELGRRGNPVAEFEAALAMVAETDVAVLVYTSGTTGPPKGAMLTHRNMAVAGDS